MTGLARRRPGAAALAALGVLAIASTSCGGSGEGAGEQEPATTEIAEQQPVDGGVLEFAVEADSDG